MKNKGHVINKSEGKRIYFGGTECANEWFGYMDGAIQAGQRIANHILLILSKQQSNHTFKLIQFNDIEFECENSECKERSNKQPWIETILPSVKQLIQLLYFLIIVFIAFFIKKYKYLLFMD